MNKELLRDLVDTSPDAETWAQNRLSSTAKKSIHLAIKTIERLERENEILRDHTLRYMDPSEMTATQARDRRKCATEFQRIIDECTAVGRKIRAEKIARGIIPDNLDHIYEYSHHINQILWFSRPNYGTEIGGW